MILNCLPPKLNKENVKIRNGFVSNSSSSSFIANRADLTPSQIRKIKNHTHYARKMGMEYVDDAWGIYEGAETISGSTMMDNFDMHEFLTRIGVDMSKVQFERDA